MAVGVKPKIKNVMGAPRGPRVPKTLDGKPFTGYVGESLDRKESGQRFRRAREALGLTRTQAALLVGLKMTRIQEIESGVQVTWSKMLWLIRSIGLDPRIMVPELFAPAPPKQPVLLGRPKGVAVKPKVPKPPKPKKGGIKFVAYNPPTEIVGVSPSMVVIEDAVNPEAPETKEEVQDPHPFVMEQGNHGGSAWAKVCSATSEKVALVAMNLHLPQPGEHWTKQYETFGDGSANPCACASAPDTHKHYLFNRVKVSPEETNGSANR